MGRELNIVLRGSCAVLRAEQGGEQRVATLRVGRLERRPGARGDQGLPGLGAGGEPGRLGALHQPPGVRGPGAAPEALLPAAGSEL